MSSKLIFNYFKQEESNFKFPFRLDYMKLSDVKIIEIKDNIFEFSLLIEIVVHNY